ncbi:MAG: sulfurtransferase complex subunit TusB [Pseudohongiellaceae bacterium]
MILHTVNKSPRASSCMDSCLRFMLPGCGLLLLEDGVYGAMATPENHQRLTAVPDNCRLYVLEEDLLARGLLQTVSEVFEIISYQGFVEICTEYSKIQNWN